jgi:hypothetical protein
MRVINHKETVEAPVSHVFDWFVNLDKNYIKWHPSTHKDFQWLSEEPVAKGSTFKFEEESDGHAHQMIMKITEFQKDQHLSFASEHIMVFPELNAVVVFTGGNFAIFRPPFIILEEYVLPAFG